MNMAHDIVKTLYKKKIIPSLYSVHTLKPLDKIGIKKFLRNTKKLL